MIKKKYKTKKAVPEEVIDPLSIYKNSRIKFFNSFEEQEEYELREMAKLSPVEILQQMRQLINIAYGMHGYDPKKLPKKRNLTIGKKE